MSETKIEWATKVWNPVTGCSPVSEGCAHCWAKRMATRLRGRCGYHIIDPFEVTFHQDRLDEPMRWKKPERVFVCSMGDLFHEDVKDEWLDDIFDVILYPGYGNALREHRFLLLTKRPQRMAEYFASLGDEDYFEHIWLGVSVENQRTADERIPILLQIPAAKRFVSIEPMLGPVDLDALEYREHRPSPTSTISHRTLTDSLRGQNIKRGDGWRIQNDWSGKLDWVILGGESGPSARPMHPDWVRSVRDQCQEAGVPFFFKQWGEWLPLDQARTHEQLKLRKSMVCLAGDGDNRDVDQWIRTGKLIAGHLLDGQEYREFPGGGEHE